MVAPCKVVESNRDVMIINLEDLEPVLRGQELQLTIPHVGLTFGDLIHDMRDLGLAESQIDAQINRIARDIRIMVLAKMLEERTS